MRQWVNLILLRQTTSNNSAATFNRSTMARPKRFIGQVSPRLSTEDHPVKEEPFDTTSPPTLLVPLCVSHLSEHS